MTSGIDYASRPSVVRQQSDEPDADALRILYLHIVEDGGRFVWQVRLHDVSDPLAAADLPSPSEADARRAGQAALDRACGQFRRFKVLD